MRYPFTRTRPGLNRTAAAVAVGLIVSLVAGPPAAADAETAPDPPRTNVFLDPATAALAAAELERLRGGFVGPDGFEFSLGLRTIAQLNDGPLVVRQLLDLRQVVRAFASGEGPAARPDLASTTPTVLQLGPGNHIDPAILGRGAGLPRTLIQNSLDGQVIRNATVYDFQLSNIGGLTQRLNAAVQSARLTQQLVDSLH